MAGYWTALGVALAAISCSRMSLEEFVREYMRARCSIAARCTGQADYLRDFCFNAGEGAAGANDAARAIKAGRASYDAGRAGACLEALASLKWCDHTALADQACAAVVRGNAAAQEACNSDWDCQSGGCTEGVAACLASRCLPADQVEFSDTGILDPACRSTFRLQLN